jgi:glycine/D-amino acid oxidase-like deaminating enzyme
MYLSWLVGQIVKNGGVVKRGIAKHINDAANLHHSGKRADVVVNCTGLSSLTLEGVEDKKLYPARGQIVVVRNDPKVMTSVSGTDDGPDEATYIMHRAAGTHLLYLSPSSVLLIRPVRRRHNSRRLSPKAQLGLPTRSQPCNPHHETLCCSLPRAHRRKGD